MQDFSENIIPHHHSISQEDRLKGENYIPKVVWFSGLSGSGKSTLASALEVQFHNLGFPTYILDGDNIRTGLNSDLNFSNDDRKENIRRIAEVAKLFNDAGIIILTAFISPFKSDRKSAKAVIGEENFIEIHVDCPLEVCEARDVKGLYRKARAGEIKNFTGINSPFEAPENPDITVDTASNSLEICLQELAEKVITRIKA